MLPRSPTASRIVADLGNSRLKWGRVDHRGEVVDVVTLDVADEPAWADAWTRLPKARGADAWAIASVNPPVASRLAAFLQARGVEQPAWFRSAAEVPIRHGLTEPETAGADRALAVLGALGDRRVGRPGLVVLCGTAVTVERVSALGEWQGGAIAAGLGLSAKALNMLTAQLPLALPREEPPAWGPSTFPALEAGVYWGVVGALRELISRQANDLEPNPWVVWTGGDAPTLARSLAWPGSEVVPDLVLRGLAGVAFKAPRG